MTDQSQGTEVYWSRDPFRPRKFKTPEELWEKCVEYFNWVSENPLPEEKVFSSAGKINRAEVAKMRAMTIQGLCLFLQISRETWYEWAKSRADLSDIIAHVEGIIRTQKFEGASADLLNSNIIARELGLVDKQELEVKTETLTPEQQVERVKQIVPQIAPILLDLGWKAPEGDE